MMNRSPSSLFYFVSQENLTAKLAGLGGEDDVEEFVDQDQGQ